VVAPRGEVEVDAEEGGSLAYVGIFKILRGDSEAKAFARIAVRSASQSGLTLQPGVLKVSVMLNPEERPASGTFEKGSPGAPSWVGRPRSVHRTNGKGPSENKTTKPRKEGGGNGPKRSK